MATSTSKRIILAAGLVLLAGLSASDLRAETRIRSEYFAGGGWGHWGGHGWGHHPGHRGAFSPDSKSIAVVRKSQIVLWDLEAQKEVAVLEHPDPVRHFEFSPDGRSLVVALNHVSVSGNQIVIWDLKSRKIRFRIEQGRGIGSMAFFGDGSRLAVGSHGFTKADTKRPPVLRVWNVDTGDELGRLDGDLSQVKGGLFDMAASPDGKWLAVHQYRTAAKGDIIVWDAETLTVQRTLRGAGGLHQLQFTPDSKLLAGALSIRAKASTRGVIDGVRLWDVASGKAVAETAFETAGDGHGWTWFTLAPDSRSLVALANWHLNDHRRLDRCAIRLWEFAAGHETDLSVGWGQMNFGDRPHHWHSDAAFSPKGDVLAVSDCESHPQVRLWAFKYQALLRTFDMTLEQDAAAPPGALRCYPWGLEFSPDGRWLTASRALPRSREHETFVWEIAPPDKIAVPARSGQ